MIREFERRDFSRLFALDQQCFAPTIAYSRAELRYFLAQPRCSCWVVELDETIDGFVIIERIRFEQQPVGHVVTLDVHPGKRRQGLGASLMFTAEVQMQREGALCMRLEVAQNNRTAQRFYRGLGFVVRGRIPRYYGGRIDAEVMEKAISA